MYKMHTRTYTEASMQGKVSQFSMMILEIFINYTIMMLSTSLMVNITILNTFCINTFCKSLKYFLYIRFHIHCPVSKVNKFCL